MFRHCTQFFRGYYLSVACTFSWRISIFRFVSVRFKANCKNLQRKGDVFCHLIFSLQARELRFSVINFQTFIGLQMCPVQTTYSNGRTAEKCLDKRLQSKQTPKDKLGNRANRWWKVQADARCQSRKKQFMLQQQLFIGL